MGSKKGGNRSTVSEEVSVKLDAFGNLSRTPAPFSNTAPLLFNGFSSCPDYRRGTNAKQIIMFRRSEVYYCEDRTTRQQKSLRTRDEAEAERIIQAKNDAVKLPQMNLVMAKTYLAAPRP